MAAVVEERLNIFGRIDVESDSGNVQDLRTMAGSRSFGHVTTKTTFAVFHLDTGGWKEEDPIGTCAVARGKNGYRLDCIVP